MNKKRRAIIILVILVLVIVTVFFIVNSKLNLNKQTVNDNLLSSNMSNSLAIGYCTNDADCVPASCCHPKACVVKSSISSCGKIFCTQECAANTLDCGQGSCSCVNNKCLAVFK